jgi:hypothetical protein
MNSLFAKTLVAKTWFAKTFLTVFVFAFACALASAIPGFGQNPVETGPGQNATHRANQSSDPIKGFNAYENFRGMVNSSGALLKLDSTIGYDFNQYLGVFTGLPLYFASDSSNTPGQTRLHDAGAGDVYFGVDVYAPNRIVNFGSTLTISAPTGSVSKGFSPGAATVDWNNRFRHTFGRLTPFVAAGVGNTVPDSELVTRNFISLGSVSHFEEGAEFQLAKPVYLGGSAFQIVPFGRQQVFNRFATASPRDGGQGNATPPLVIASETTGNDLTREHGFDAWIGFEPTRVVRLELGYSRSVTFALNSFSFNVGLNVGKLLRSKAH